MNSNNNNNRDKNNIPVQRINVTNKSVAVTHLDANRNPIQKPSQQPQTDSHSEQRGTSYVRCGQDLGRVATHTKNVFREATPEPIINTIYERAPTPEPDVIEKIYIKREPKQVFETIYQRPKTPPPIIIERHFVEAAPEEVHTCKIVDIDHSPRSVEQLEIRHEPIRVNADFDYSSIFEIKTTTSTHASQSYQASSSRAQSSHYSNQNANASSYYNGFQRNVDLYQSNYRF